MKNIVFTLLAIVVFFTASYSQDGKECKKWKTGRFYMLTPDNIRIEIARKGNTQVEYNTQTGESSHLKIKWTSPCSYELRKDPKYKGKNAASGLVIQVKIIEIKEAYIMIEVSSKEFDLKFQDKFFRSDQK